MKERPILMSTEMVQSTLKGWKTQTRRMRGLKKLNDTPCTGSLDVGGYFVDNMGRLCHGVHLPGDPFASVPMRCPYGKPGDILWVRETWQTTYNEFSDQWFPIYRADGGTWIDDDGPMRWKPSIHMPKKYARIYLRITNIRLDRVNNISERDAIAEGIQPLLMSRQQKLCAGQQIYRDYLVRGEGIFQDGIPAKESFKSLWTRINGVNSWDHFSWVWVISFEVLSTTGHPEFLSQASKISQP